jgi:hypothetical protein
LLEVAGKRDWWKWNRNPTVFIGSIRINWLDRIISNWWENKHWCRPCGCAEIQSTLAIWYKEPPRCYAMPVVYFQLCRKIAEYSLRLSMETICTHQCHICSNLSFSPARVSFSINMSE